MPTAEAHVETDRPSRYLVQLCRHADQMGRRHRPGAHATGDEHSSRELRVHVEWSDTHGIINLTPWGRCTMQATSRTLALRADATNEENLRRIQNLVTERLERFGRRDHLTVSWLPPTAAAAVHPDTDFADEPGAAHAEQADVVRRGRRAAIILTAAGSLGIALAVAAHLLGAAALVASRWLGWTALGVVMVPTMIVLGHVLAPASVIGLRHLAGRRRTAAVGVSAGRLASSSRLLSHHVRDDRRSARRTSHAGR
jgi:hypothetical protein